MSLEVLPHFVHQRCDGCDATRRLDFDQLEVGIVPDAGGDRGFVDDDRVTPLVALPPCDACGAVEFVRAPGGAARGDDDTLARLWTRLRLPRPPTRPVADVVDGVSADRYQESP
jgi:hypothetical protein